MAYTRIHPIKNSIRGAINYIINPAKTEGKILVSSYACTPETAALDFAATLARSERSGPNKAYQQHGLSVITEKKYKAKDYAEWMADKDGTSWKSKLKSEINATIRASHTYEEFIQKLRDKGYEIVGENMDDPHHKYISFRAPGQTRSTRGKAKTLGPDFTRERIKERIEEKTKERTERMKKALHPGRFIDTSSDMKYDDNPYLKRWADIHN